MIRSFSLLALFSLSLLTLPSHAAAEALPAAASAQAGNRPVVLVRVLALEGTGPDLQQHRLYADADGVITTLDALGRVGYQVGGEGLAEGGYHTLFVTLADEYEVVQGDGTRTQRRFSEEEQTTRRRVRGMIMVRGGQATPLRMLDDPSYYGSRREAFRQGRDEDDDD
jgi:hypothetical protein